jgi:cytochrome o ubiquinol oxidase subunit IV
MSAHSESPVHADDHGGHHTHHEHDGGMSHATLKGYVTGFLLSVVLTAIPFWLVMGKVTANPTVTALVILGFAAVQIVVHIMYFLHMDTKSQAGWSMLALIFTIVLVVIMLSGSLWVMFHLKENMMPATAEQMRNMP